MMRWLGGKVARALSNFTINLAGRESRLTRPKLLRCLFNILAITSRVNQKPAKIAANAEAES